ncbi:MAG TPA: isoprenyl transferase [Deltaproteobacteria bacterium]|nr:isoprenyl transferase [Deltaproteobacteria bacterium]
MEKFPREKLPRHIAIIMDGNGRWAQGRSLARINGHRKGINRARDVVTFSRELGIECLTLYTFSRENWNRPAHEVSLLMGLLERHLMNEARNMVENNIRLRAIGNVEELPARVREVVARVEEMTSGGTGMLLQLALSYSGRSEIVEAARSLVRDAVAGRIGAEDIDEERFASRLFTAGVPDPDLLIRTSGELRLSNFLLWQSAYTEIYIADVLWPDFTKEHFLKAIEAYTARQRRFGLTGDQAVKAVG